MQMVLTVSMKLAFGCVLLVLINPLVAVEESISCPQGFGSNKMMVIEASRINDGFCDCPTTGEDEPDTQACSGREEWAGAGSTESPTEKRYFTCPQQPDLRIPLSRINDGICDCCDGGDEEGADPPVNCKDDCAAILEARRREREAIQNAYSTGSKTRQDWIKTFSETRTETLVKINEAREKQQQLEDQIQENTELFKKEQMRLLEDRTKETHHLMKQLVHPQMPFGSLFSLVQEELVSFIVYACQLAGEFSKEKKTNTCVPLRLSALDIGMTWAPETYEWERVESMELRAQLTDYNLANDQPIWTKKELESKQRQQNRKRRRLDEEYEDFDEENYEDEEDYHDDYDHDYDNEDYMGDDMPYDEEGYNSEYSNHEEDNVVSDDVGSDGGEREKLLETVRSTSFSRTRVSFLQQADLLLQRIKTLTKTESEEDEKAEDTEKSSEESVEEERADDIDPMALPVVRSQLEKRKSKIERGFDAAVSAHKLLQGRNETSLEVLTHLAAGVVNHAQITTLQFYEILYNIIPELQNDNAPVNKETCASPWAYLCPPKLAQRNGSPILTSALVMRLLEHCTIPTQPEPEVCQAQAAPSVPSSIPDGYFGYYEPQPRDDFDSISNLCAPVALSDPENKRKNLNEIEARLDSIEDEKKNLDDEITKMETSIGGLEEPVESLGIDGELFTLQNKCFDVEAGKYTYEICLFGKSHQKEKSGGRTSLGDWEEASFDDASRKRIWKWANGQKCWNGPMRSMTAYIRCGAETKILSADEPDTCRYEVQVESPVACDDSYGVEHGLVG